MVRKRSPSLPFLSKPPLLFVQTDLSAPDKHTRVHAWKCMMHVIFTTGFFYSKAFGVCSQHSKSHPIAHLGGHRCSLREDTTPSLTHQHTNDQEIPIWGTSPVNYQQNVFLDMCSAATFRCIYLHLQVRVQMKGSFWSDDNRTLYLESCQTASQSSCCAFLSPLLGYEAPRVPHPP